MNTTDYIIIGFMGIAAVVAAGAFSAIAKYLFDRGLVDRNASPPNIMNFYKTYIAHTRKKTGRIGGAFWIHSMSAGIFISTGVVYTIVRLVLPRFF
ncbi:MAG: hypothetical protein HGJ94_18750 [Desulfosarcina sp.]|nr:hypothetical protein [Desulfosarcina sp.]MBC2743298.1 hypothetical protein [Desulfosarcina sp.]MBC2766208.1 hypothetical protein [Desulfosarcina sp.]